MYWWVLIVLIICYRFFKVELYDIWVVVYVMINWFNIWDHTYKELVIMRPVFLQENQGPEARVQEWTVGIREPATRWRFKLQKGQEAGHTPSCEAVRNAPLLSMGVRPKGLF